MPDEAVIDQLFAQCAGRLGAYGYLLTGSQSAGEELVQAAIVKVFVKRRKLDNVKMAESYVRTTMQRMHVDRYRRDSVWRRVMPGQAVVEPQPDASDELVTRDAVQTALASLPTQVRTAVVLRYLDDMTVAEVADAMRLATGTVKRYLSDGRALLAPLLGTDDNETADKVAVVQGSRK